MPVNIYARQAPISDACGRADYIGSDDRQENLMATATTSPLPNFWQLLSADAQAAFRQSGGRRTKADGTMLQACEAREIHLQLPNEALLRMQADQLAQTLANDFKSQYGVDCMVAIHYNKTQTNLHCHIMFSERQLLQEPEIKVADRNVFLDANGIRKRTKKEITNADGELLPGCSIVKKGEILSARYFADKNPMFAERGWMNEYRHHMCDWINENLKPDKLRTVYDPKGPYLAQKHLGPLKDNEALAAKRRDIEKWNGLVRTYNYLVESGKIPEDDALEYKTRIMLSPNQTQELTAVLAEVHCEIHPDSQHRPTWEKLAKQAAATPLSPAVRNRQEKEALRRLYVAQGKAKMAAADAAGTFDAVVRNAEVKSIGSEIAKKKLQAGVSPDLQQLHEIGRLCGVKKDEVDQLYRAIPRMTSQQWSEVWGYCKEIKSDFWGGYQSRQQQIRDELDEAYKLRRKVKAAEWVLDPRNRRKSLLSVLIAAIILLRNDSLWKIDHDINQLKREQTAMRRGAQRFKAATVDVHDTLHTRGLEPDRYLAAVERLQLIADQVNRQHRPLQQTKSRDDYAH